MYAEKMQLRSGPNVKTTPTAPYFLANKKNAVIERDSGVYEPTGESYSTSRRSSVCSSGVPAVSPNTTSSSAYSSAASTCSENEGQRRRSRASSPFEGNLKKIQAPEIADRIPFHPHLVQHQQANFSENVMKNVATSTLYKNRNRGVASSSKTDHVPMESGRRLYDQANNRTFEKKRLLGKVRIFPALSFDCTVNF